MLHVMADGNMPAEPAGVLDHMASSASDLTGIANRLQARGVKYLLKRQVATKTLQLFCCDPNGVKVELNFSPNEALPLNASVVEGQ